MERLWMASEKTEYSAAVVKGLKRQSTTYSWHPNYLVYRLLFTFANQKTFFPWQKFLWTHCLDVVEHKNCSWNLSIGFDSFLLFRRRPYLFFLWREKGIYSQPLSRFRSTNIWFKQGELQNKAHSVLSTK